MINSKVLFGPHYSYLVHVGPFCPFWFYLVHIGSIWSNLSTWSYLVDIGPIHSTMVLFGPTWSTLFYSVHFGPIWSSLFPFCPIFLFIRSTLFHLVQLDHFSLFRSTTIYFWALT